MLDDKIVISADLGGRSEQSLIKDGVDPALAHKLVPYTGMKGSVAARYVAEHPLDLTQEEALGISYVYREKTTAENFNATVQAINPDSTLRFEDLPYNTKTAIVDLRYQYGPGVNVTPGYTVLIASGSWQDVVDELRNFHDAYKSRREDEAKLIEADIKAGYLKADRLK
ncbi:pesticin C-terminus-like muramidase [Entomobacter blattae]